MAGTERYIVKHLHCRKMLCGVSLAVCATVAMTAAEAGDFSIDWSTFDWPAGFAGPLVRTLDDQYGFEIDATVEMTGSLRSYSTDAQGNPILSPDDVDIFGGGVESLVVIGDAAPNAGRRGDDRITASVTASSGGVAFQVDNLLVDILDMDASDAHSTADRCDFVTAFGDNGNPSISTLGPAPTVVVGPGLGSGDTGLLNANEAQCLFIDGSAVLSPTSNNDSNGSIRLTYPDATSRIEIWYDESIGEVRSYYNPVTLPYDAGARGIGIFAEVNFTTDQTIGLTRFTSPLSALQGNTITFIYEVTNTGELPFNPNQDVVIQDSLVGTVTCPAITAPVAPGGTVTCTAEYTVTAADALSGAVDSTATAGIGAIGTPFVSRLQSNPENASIVANVLSTDTGPQTCTPQSVFGQPRTQLAGAGSAFALTTSDIFVYDNVTTDINGNDLDVVFQATEISNAINVNIDGSLEARMTPIDNGFVTYRLRLVQDGSATPSNPQGTPVEQSRINGVIIQQTDVDSRGTTDDSSDVVGPLLAPDGISYFHTAPLASFPANGQAITMDPAKTGDPTNWIDEPNESSFDNYVTYEYGTFTEGEFIHGYTGTSQNDAARGSSIRLCAVTNTSASVVAGDDDYTASPLNSLLGGTAGEVMSNDTINGLPAAFPTATLDVLTEAVPQNTGDPVPVLETQGADAGRVIVPPGVPSGTYEIEYELCDNLDPTQCDRARVIIAVFDGLGVDFGDAPISYLTASHGVSDTPLIYLGSIPPDIELVAQSDASATADDLLDTDDEDAVVFPVMTQGVISTLNVPVTGAGYLQAWIDFNGDGVFEGSFGENIASDLRDDGTGFDDVAGDGVIQIDVSVPSDATTSTTFARFRYSSEAGLPVASFAVDGEVEDYSLVIAAADLVDRGDAPASYGEPRHIIASDIYLGGGVPDSETETMYSASADGDDLDGIDDEDSIAVFPVLEAGTIVPLTIQTHETLSVQLALGIPVTEGITNLQVWIDFNQNNVFDPTEQVAVNFRDGGLGDTDGSFNNQITLNIPVPADVGNGTSFARVRWSTSSALTQDPFSGLNFDGEVEDYLVTLVNLLPQGAIEGTLYEDADSSGSRDGAETTLPAGIGVTLFDDAGTPVDPADDTVVGSTETDAAGAYLFNNLDPARGYLVEVDETDPEIPAGLVLTTGNPIASLAVDIGSGSAVSYDFGFENAPTEADLALAQTILHSGDGTPATEAAAEDALDIVLTLSNSGPGSPSDVRVLDLIPDGFAYVSDDAAAQGDSYDPATGVWLLGDVLAGSSHSLTIRVTMQSDGTYENQAEIIGSSLIDLDSDPDTGALVDDLGDGLADDDEARASVTLSTTGPVLSGTVFFDIGASGAAYDGTQQSGEQGTDRAEVQIFDAGGVLLATPAVAADGMWRATLPDGYSGAVTVTALPGTGLLNVSEGGAALPGLVNSDPHDGSITFTPAAGTSYATLDFGMVEAARLNQSQERTIRAGQVLVLRHEYIAAAPGSVSFNIAGDASTLDGAFSTALYEDTDCDGTADQAITGPLPTDAGTLICVLARVTASGAATQGSTYRFDLLADTSYGASGLSQRNDNTDRLVVEAAQGTLQLTKTVRNVTQGSPEGVSNGASAGDVLEYRIYVETVGTVPARDIVVYDRTPPYTALSSAVPSPITLADGVECTLDEPLANTPGYDGALRWSCTGVLQPGAQGFVAFEVSIQ